jgi:hypothetical protein
VTKLKIGILSYRSAPFGGGQGIYVRDISNALVSLGHSVDVISGSLIQSFALMLSLLSFLE